MRKQFPQFVSIVIALCFAGFASAAPPIVGGEPANETPVVKSASMNGGTLTIELAGVYGTDDKAGIITPRPVPDGSIVCAKANGRQSANWRGGATLGKIVMTPEACAWGSGTVKDGKVTLSAPACSSDIKEGTALISAVVQLPGPDGKQAWVPHFGTYRVFNAKGVDATGIAFNCNTNKVALVIVNETMAKLF